MIITYARGVYHTLEGDTWYFKKRYIAVSDGSITNLKGHSIKCRYLQQTMTLIDDDDVRRNIRINRFILSSFIEEKPPIGYHADHKDEEKWFDNSLENLQWLSPGDNTLKKRKPVRDRHSCIPIVCILQTGEHKYFSSLLHASNLTDISDSTIGRICFKNRNGLIHKYNDCFWSYDFSKIEQTIYKEEIWRTPLMRDGSEYSKDINIKVSSLGRIMWCKPIIRIFNSTTLNTERDEYKKNRASVKIQFERRKLHELICTTFHGPSPFEGAIVRHLNDDYKDCSITNLCWGSRKENSYDAKINNKTRSIEIKIDDMTFDSITDASIYLGISTGQLSVICRKSNMNTFSSELFTMDVYNIDSNYFCKREHIARHLHITISQARTLQRKGIIKVIKVKTIDADTAYGGKCHACGSRWKQ